MSSSSDVFRRLVYLKCRHRYIRRAGASLRRLLVPRGTNLGVRTIFAIFAFATSTDVDWDYEKSCWTGLSSSHTEAHVSRNSARPPVAVPRGLKPRGLDDAQLTRPNIPRSTQSSAPSTIRNSTPYRVPSRQELNEVLTDILEYWTILENAEIEAFLRSTVPLVPEPMGTPNMEIIKELAAEWDRRVRV